MLRCLNLKSVGPHPIVRSSWLFLQRCVALCLLLLYGVPASIGPHWHHHEVCSHAHSGTSCSAESDLENQCCSHEPHAVAPEESSGKARPQQFVVGHSVCAICFFYAQAQVEQRAAADASNDLVIASTNPASFKAESAWLLLHGARGPPLFV